jgi:hypothetical protein
MRRALLVGIDNYPAAPLSGCVADADEIAGLLRTNVDGSPNFDCQLVAGPPLTISKAFLRRKITELFQQPADLAFFYFSGHGTENNLGGYLVTADAATYDEGVAMTEVLALAHRSPIAEIVIVLDCCNSGAFGGLPTVSNDAATLREGIAVLTASRSDEAAIELAGRGLFTRLVCDALAGGAADVLGNVTVASVYTYVDESLGAWEQRPLFKAHVSRLLPLRKDRPAVALDLLRQLTTWFPTEDAVLPLDPSFEPTEEPHDTDHEALLGHLQKCRDAKLVEPVGEEHMYYAAMHSTGCRLTPLGRHYWRLAREGRI